MAPRWKSIGRHVLAEGRKPTAEGGGVGRGFMVRVPILSCTTPWLVALVVPHRKGARHGAPLHSADPQLIDVFERCSTAAADDGGAVSADERIIDGFLTSRAVEFLSMLALSVVRHYR
jgi:hypothetical protein